ncbi:MULTISPECIES: hypothetical protein [Xanthomonas]|nr:hypothetical protein [Xanthomonas cucurbitae]
MGADPMAGHGLTVRLAGPARLRRPRRRANPEAPQARLAGQPR